MHSIELLPDEATERVVRRVWRAIADEGLPSQAGHRHPTNRPHLTLATADVLPAATRGALAEALDALPLPLHLTGLLRFSGRSNVLAWAVRPDAALLRLHESVWRILVHPGGRAPGEEPGASRGRRAGRHHHTAGEVLLRGGHHAPLAFREQALRRRLRRALGASAFLRPVLSM
ncbi:2'-5' RNA ligase family protein [Streptomyces arboris]|uniref:2'-5' RNA ligase family protein n=1 Tax=Streptomyces arboris TaxID=2600619 RepID=UPI003BF46CFB